jgi:hypothetical protein
MHARNAGLQRLRSVTRRVGIVAVALTGVFVGLAAAANSGHHRLRTERRDPVPRRPAPVAAKARVPPPPSLPPLPGGEDGGGSAQPSGPAPAPQPPPAPPAEAYSPPVAVSGGS